LVDIVLLTDSSACPSCGTAHPAAARYCLACGALVGRRPVDPETAVAVAPEPAAAATPPVAPPTPRDGAWRWPAAAVLTTLALATGIVAGALLQADDDAAGRRPVVLGSVAAAPVSAPLPGTSATPPATAANTVAPPPAIDAGAVKTPAKVPAATTPKRTPSTSGATTTAPPATTTTTPVTPTAKSKSTKKPKGAIPATTAASDLPEIDHIWVVGTAAPIVPADGSYVGDVLLPRATILPRYAPVATDPLAGAAALIAGRAPSADAPTLAGQLTRIGKSWRAYAAGASGCSGPAGTDPFLAFPSVTGAKGCADAVADLSTLTADLESDAAPPAFSYIATDPALDATALDDLLRQLVEPLRHNDTYKKSGLVAIVPTSANPIAATGALLLSPFVAGSTEDDTALGPYTLLRTFEDLLDLDHLGHAADADVKPLSSDILVPEG